MVSKVADDIPADRVYGRLSLVTRAVPSIRMVVRTYSVKSTLDVIAASLSSEIISSVSRYAADLEHGPEPCAASPRDRRHVHPAVAQLFGPSVCFCTAIDEPRVPVVHP